MPGCLARSRVASSALPTSMFPGSCWAATGSEDVGNSRFSSRPRPRANRSLPVQRISTGRFQTHGRLGIHGLDVGCLESHRRLTVQRICTERFERRGWLGVCGVMRKLRTAHGSKDLYGKIRNARLARGSRGRCGVVRKLRAAHGSKDLYGKIRTARLARVKRAAAAMGWRGWATRSCGWPPALRQRPVAAAQQGSCLRAGGQGARRRVGCCAGPAAPRYGVDGRGAMLVVRRGWFRFAHKWQVRLVPEHLPDPGQACRHLRGRAGR